MGMLNRDRRIHPCPQCGGMVKRVHRRLADRMLSVLHPVLRYRCLDDACGREGTLSRDGKELNLSNARIAEISRRRGALVILAGVVMAIVSAHAAFTHLWDTANRDTRTGRQTTTIARSAPERLQVPVGESYDGDDLTEDDLRKADNPSPLTLRRGCAWGVPGRTPYQGNVAQALLAARVPESAVRKFEAMVEKKLVSDQVEISRAGITTVSGRRSFDGQSFDMAFGNTMCFNTRVNFKPGHVERADLYEATDADGKRYVVMVPYVCGNVSVLGDFAERAVLPDTVAQVPEPRTLAMFASGLALLAWFAHRRKRPADSVD